MGTQVGIGMGAVRFGVGLLGIAGLNLDKNMDSEWDLDVRVHEGPGLRSVRTDQG